MTWISRRTSLRRSTKPIRRRLRPKSSIPNRGGTYREKVAYANRLWVKLIYAKEPSGICPMCHKRNWSDAAHCFAKGPYPMLRFELSNGAPLCRPCHRRVDSDHLAKEQFFRSHMGRRLVHVADATAPAPAEYDRLELMALAHTKTNIDMKIIELERLGR